MSNNFFKAGNVVREDEVRVIQSNELVSKKLEHLANFLKEDGENFTDGFLEGIDAKQVEVLLAEEPVPAETVTTEQLNELSGEKLRETERECESKVAAANAEAENILKKAREDAEAMKEQAQAEGFLAGQSKINAQLAKQETEYQSKIALLEKDYLKKAEELEPMFVETITGIYEHIFNIQLEEYHDLVVHLINRAMGGIEAGKHYLIHVSKADFPYVSMKKKELLQGTGVNADTVEIIEDFSISRGQCLIETGGGIYDCGLGTQMERLNKELRLLSYEHD